MKSKFKALFSRAPRSIADPLLQKRRDQARDLHLVGDLEGAAHVYRSLLEADPDDAELAYRFGNVQKDQGLFDRALELYDRAVAVKPDYSQAYCNRAVVLGFLDRPADALDSYNRAINIDPTDSIAQCNRAMLLLGLGQKDAALAGFEAALEFDANIFTAQFGRGALLQERKLWQAALFAYDRAIAINPEDAATFYNRAVVAVELKRWDEALHDCARAVAFNPQFSSAYGKRAEILQELKQYPEALASYDQAIQLNPRDPATFNNRGVLRQLMRQFEAALSDYDQAIALNPTDPAAWFNRGTVLKELDVSQGALAAYDRSISLRPDYDAAYVNRGALLQEQGRVQDAAASYRKALAIKPDLAEAHYNLSHASLALGDYVQGWSEHEWRWHAKGGSIYREKRNFTQPLWLGQESIAGKTILLYAEQGLGDCLQFCRYVELVANLGARVVLEVPGSLVTLLAALPGTPQVVAFGDQLPPFDIQCPLMSLPLAFHTTLEVIPSSTGYLKSNPSKLATWQQRLGAKIRPRIGLAWSGNRAPGTNLKRHFPLSRLIPYLPAAFEYFCLQPDTVVADQETLKNSKIVQFQGLFRDFSDTAALCECMDLVISVDTSVAHLACALGIRTWVLLAYSADWRWLLDREDSPWYSSARLFRQKFDGSWDELFERLAKDLRDRPLHSNVPLA